MKTFQRRPAGLLNCVQATKKFVGNRSLVAVFHCRPRRRSRSGSSACGSSGHKSSRAADQRDEYAPPHVPLAPSSERERESIFTSLQDERGE